MRCGDRDEATRGPEAEGRLMASTALTSATRGLEDCLREWSRSGPDARLAEALRYNLRLWTLFECDLSRPDHGFLPQLRVDLLERCALVDRRTCDLMSEPTSAKLRSLIAINRELPLRHPASALPPSDSWAAGETEGVRP